MTISNEKLQQTDLTLNNRYHMAHGMVGGLDCVSLYVTEICLRM